MKIKIGYSATVALIVIGSFFLVRTFNNLHEANLIASSLDKTELANSALPVRVARVVKSPKQVKYVVNGETRAAATVTLYSKASGYVRDIQVDRGSRVKKGEILARIDSPETDKAYKAAISDFNFKKSTYLKTKELGKRKLESAINIEGALADFEGAQARMEAVKVLRDNQTLRAPFDGVVSERFVDPGALIQTAGAQPIVTVSRLDLLKVVAYIDQRLAPHVHIGTAVSIKFLAQPGLEMTSTVSRVSGELDYMSKSLVAEIDIANKDERLLGGGFAQVTVNVDLPQSLSIPSEALIASGESPKVALVDADNRINIRNVKVIENDGRFVSIGQGVQEGDRVLVYQGNSVSEGQSVSVVAVVNEDTPKVANSEENLRKPAANPKTDQKSQAK